jgi:hypothetical protein
MDKNEEDRPTLRLDEDLAATLRKLRRKLLP